MAVGGGEHAADRCDPHLVHVVPLQPPKHALAILIVHVPADRRLPVLRDVGPPNRSTTREPLQDLALQIGRVHGITVTIRIIFVPSAIVVPKHQPMIAENT